MRAWRKRPSAREERDIAARLGIGLASVQTYRKRAYRKLGVGGLPALFYLLLNGEHLG